MFVIYIGVFPFYIRKYFSFIVLLNDRSLVYYEQHSKSGDPPGGDDADAVKHSAIAEIFEKGGYLSLWRIWP
ncbi:hypothetical protein [Lacticaseibacillus mingshuiensis]|uniref:hypothetical protein n=1 Tax=Lacticaseibacillus mingshuiensis TaxID=2799574 RepID=UPI001944AA76|nr:hypothetical protein [Lacticaseibacillus mingshuiensis]